MDSVLLFDIFSCPITAHLFNTKKYEQTHQINEIDKS